MEGRGCPSIVYSRDYDYVNHMCPYLASLMRCGVVDECITQAWACCHRLDGAGQLWTLVTLSDAHDH